MRHSNNLVLITALAIMPPCALAHHGSAGQFDMRSTLVTTGTITRVRLVNPHAYVYFDVENAAGEVVNFRCELQSGSTLKRAGWTKDMFEVGTTISINGSPDRSDPTTCHMNDITFENGQVAFRYSRFDDEGNIEPEARQIERDDGMPNIDGNWAMVRVAGVRPGSGGFGQVVLTEAGVATSEGATSADNPRFQCRTTNIVFDWWFDQMVNSIQQSADQIKIKYGFMDLQRTIYLDGTQMPEDYVPSRAGFSTGAWDGGTLVVTTTGFNDGWINAPMGRGARGDRPEGRAPKRGANDDRIGPSGRPERPEGGPPQPVKNSAELIVTERFTLNDDGTVLTRNFAFVDPINLSLPIEGSDKVTLTSDAYLPFECDDLTNERNK